jgi:hypothetical protein
MSRSFRPQSITATSFSRTPPGNMANRNHLNAYAGPSALRDYFDPDVQPMLPLVEIPQSLNPFYDDGVRIHAKMMSMHPANNVKIMPGMFVYLEYVIRRYIAC